MFKNIHPSKISFNKARNYYFSDNTNSLYKIKKVLKYSASFANNDFNICVYYQNMFYQFDIENGYTIRVAYNEMKNKYDIFGFVNYNIKRNICFEFMSLMLFTIDMSENYKLITMLICNKYNKNNESNKVLSDKYLMRFIASYL